MSYIYKLYKPFVFEKSQNQTVGALPVAADIKKRTKTNKKNKIIKGRTIAPNAFTFDRFWNLEIPLIAKISS